MFNFRRIFRSFTLHVNIDTSGSISSNLLAMFDISSPRAPSEYHRAMLAYHAFQLEESKKDFLSYWFDRDQPLDGSPSSLAQTCAMDILQGITLLRNRVVSESRRSFRQRRGDNVKKSVSLRFVLEVLTEIRDKAFFPDATSYWDNVIANTSELGEPTVGLVELSEAVLAFLNNESSDTSKLEHEDSTRSVSVQDSARSLPPLPIENRRAVPSGSWCRCVDPGECMLQ